MSITLSADDPEPSPGLPFGASEIERTLEIIGRSEEFGRSGRLAELLRFIVAEEMTGRGDRLKAYAIATKVLGRNADFDAAQDSIVRVEIARLRTALKLFYSRGVETPVLIDIPKGGYRPVFSAASAARKETSPQPEASPHGGRRKEDPKRGARFSGIWTYAAAGAALMLAGGLALVLQPGPAQTPAATPPLVLVSPVTISSPDPAMKAFERGLKGELVAELSAYQWMSVAYRSEAATATSLADRRSVYTVNMNMVIEGKEYSSVTTLQEAVTGRVRSTYLDKGTLPDTQVFPSLAAAARRIAADIGQPLGAVTQAELENSPDKASGPYSCVLGLRRYILGWSQVDRDAFRACALAQPRQTDAVSLGLAAFANLDAARRGVGDRSALIAAAASDIETAMTARPRLHLILTTAALVSACRGDVTKLELIIADISNNRPNDPKALADIAHIRAFVLGEIATAMALARQARTLALNPQPDDSTIPALDAMMRQDWAATIRFVNEPPQSTNPLALSLLMAAHGETGDRAGALAAASALAKAGFPDPNSIRAYVANECLAETVRKRIREGLTKALALL
jgi:adenylate cyclase